MNLETQILSWEKPLVNAGAVSYYYVEWYKEGRNPNPKREKANTNQLKVEMLKPKTTYSIKVQGLNDHKNRLGEYSSVYTFQTKAEKPEKPKIPKSTNRGNSQPHEYNVVRSRTKRESSHKHHYQQT